MRLKRVVEHRNDSLLQFVAEIDQHVLATDHVEVRKGRIGAEVLAGEDTKVANRLADAIAVVGLGEEPPQPLRRNVQRDVAPIKARSGPRDRRLVDVGAKNLDRNLRGLRAEKLHQADGDRIGFLARSTTWNPNPNR